ncbi:Mss4-like protein [Podospora appendiculata]|uniref:Mss4-like protein n=1 Tax=Podospora appendiculata TaxID=314037 RepID=A0AAE0XLH7_9PEZI|nr:Mss4-like protein [Podospora appendiculata]
MTEASGKRGIVTISSCLCGAARQTLACRAASSDRSNDDENGKEDTDWEDIALCHCDICRQVTGQLFTSYIPIRSSHSPGNSKPVSPSLDGLVEYSPATAPSSKWYFCANCGCHIFRCSTPGSGNGDELQWEVATGIIIDSPDLEEKGYPQAKKETPWRHMHVEDTLDGGLSVWLPSSHAQQSKPHPDHRHGITDNANKAKDNKPPIPPPHPDAEDLLPASCHCGTITFHISRPNPSSALPRSSFPDLSHPYTQTPQSTVSNPSDEKWWLCEAGRYRAGTCACRSCRLASGFEIQSWAFIPRCNVHLSVSPAAAAVDGTTYPPPYLATYESSPRTLRTFCPTCGATLSWHSTDQDRRAGGLLDISVGLLRAPSGSRAETWLSWWTGRVSFAEDAGLQRTGAAAGWARRLVEALEAGLREGGKEGEGAGN